MSDRLDEDIRRWAHQVMHSVLEATGFSNLNAVERIIRDPGIAYYTAQSRVLWWPWGRRVAKIHRAAHQLTVMERVMLMVDAGVVMDNEGKPMTIKEFCKACKGPESKFPAYVNRAKGKIRKLIASY